MIEINDRNEFIDLVHFQTAQIMYKAKKNLLPGNIQKLFLNGEERYNFRRECNFKHLYVRTIFNVFQSMYFCMWSEIAEQTKSSAQAMPKCDPVQKAVQTYGFQNVYGGRTDLTRCSYRLFSHCFYLGFVCIYKYM